MERGRGEEIQKKKGKTGQEGGKTGVRVDLKRHNKEMGWGVVVKMNAISEEKKTMSSFQQPTLLLTGFQAFSAT